jgi:hypothetical protein
LDALTEGLKHLFLCTNDTLYQIKKAAALNVQAAAFYYAILSMNNTNQHEQFVLFVPFVVKKT